MSHNNSRNKLAPRVGPVCRSMEHMYVFSLKCCSLSSGRSEYGIEVLFLSSGRLIPMGWSNDINLKF